MSKDIDAILLNIGNETVKALMADELTGQTMPYGSWQVNYTVEQSTLKFNVLLDYNKLVQNYAGNLADPTLWITIVALFTSEPLYGQLSNLPNDIRFVFVVNSGQEGKKDWEASCTVKELVCAQLESKGKSLDEASTVMMIAMDLSSR